MAGRTIRVVVWALGTVLALSGLSFAATGALDRVADDAPDTIVQDPRLVTNQEDEDLPPAEELDGDGEGEDDGITVDDGEEPAASRWSTEGCPDGFSGNHGAYVSSVEKTGEARSTAARSKCGKPVKPDDGTDDDDDTDEAAEVSGRESGKTKADQASGGRSSAGASNGQRADRSSGESKGKGADRSGAGAGNGAGKGRSGR